MENLHQNYVIDHDNAIFIRATLPGVKKEENYRREIRSGNLLRTIALPASVDENLIKDDLLELTFPKIESDK